MESIDATLFASTTVEGRAFASRLGDVCREETLGGFNVKLNTVFDGTQADMMVAGLRDDLVIFDGSVEETVGRNYKAAHMWPSCMEHFLVVSRTPLPMNFQPYHSGGIVVGPRNDGYTNSNRQLIRWLDEKVRNLGPLLHRPPEDRFHTSFERLGADWQLIQPIIERLIRNATAKRAQERKCVAFVSYLSRHSVYSPQYLASDGLSVEDLISYMQDNRGGPIAYFKPGQLSGEFLTESRRWQLQTIIDHTIRAAGEVWVFDTDGYHDSWWTMAELLSVAYIAQAEGSRIPKIIHCKQSNDSFSCREVDLSFLPHLSAVQAREFGRYLCNSDPLTMGRETVKNVQAMRRLPRWALTLALKGAAAQMSSVLSNSQLYRDMNSADGKLWDVDAYLEMANSHVFDDSFWNDHIVTCSRCMEQNTRRHSFDFDSFVGHTLPGQHRLSSAEVEGAVSRGNWFCPNCGTGFHIVSAPYAQFNWWPVRNGQTTGPNGVYVEQLPVYLLR